MPFLSLLPCSHTRYWVRLTGDRAYPGSVYYSVTLTVPAGEVKPRCDGSLLACDCDAVVIVIEGVAFITPYFVRIAATDPYAPERCGLIYSAVTSLSLFLPRVRWRPE